MLVNISFDIELYNDDMTMLLAHVQEVKEGLVSEGWGRDPSISIILFLIKRAIHITQLQVV